MACTHVLDTSADDHDGDDLIIVVNNDGSIIADEETLHALELKPNEPVSLVWVSRHSNGDDNTNYNNTDDDIYDADFGIETDGISHVDIIVDYRAVNVEYDTPEVPGYENVFVDSFLANDSEKLATLEHTVLLEEVKQILVKNTTALPATLLLPDEVDVLMDEDPQPAGMPRGPCQETLMTNDSEADVTNFPQEADRDVDSEEISEDDSDSDEDYRANSSSSRRRRHRSNQFYRGVHTAGLGRIWGSSRGRELARKPGELKRKFRGQPLSDFIRNEKKMKILKAYKKSVRRMLSNEGLCISRGKTKAIKRARKSCISSSLESEGNSHIDEKKQKLNVIDLLPPTTLNILTPKVKRKHTKKRNRNPSVYSIEDFGPELFSTPDIMRRVTPLADEKAALVTSILSVDDKKVEMTGDPEVVPARCIISEKISKEEPSMDISNEGDIAELAVTEEEVASDWLEFLLESPQAQVELYSEPTPGLQKDRAMLTDTPAEVDQCVGNLNDMYRPEESGSAWMLEENEQRVAGSSNGTEELAECGVEARSWLPQELDDQSCKSEDDPDRLWCVCRKPHNNRFMICCDVCSEWFHGRCVGISKAVGQQMPMWCCPNCSYKRT